jgi:hypothetical protein
MQCDFDVTIPYEVMEGFRLKIKGNSLVSLMGIVRTFQPYDVNRIKAEYLNKVKDYISPYWRIPAE